MNRQRGYHPNRPSKAPRLSSHLRSSRHRRASEPPWKLIILIAGGGGGLLLLLVIAAIYLWFSPGVAPAAAVTPILPESSPTIEATLPITPTSASQDVATPTLTPEKPLETQPPVPTFTPFEIQALEQFMIQLINDDRRANGLAEVARDSTAATAGQRHAEEMARFGYLSHWNLDGNGPDYRYNQAGGFDAVRENVYLYQHSPNLAPTSAEDWQTLIRQAEQALMDSPGHRDNILASGHTHIGVGIAYEPTSGSLAIAQEFIDRYLVLQSISKRFSIGDSVTLSGRLDSRGTNPMLNLAYESFPSPLTVTDLKSMGAYESPAQIYEVIKLIPDDKGRFEQTVVLNNNGQPGLYHLRIGVDTHVGSVIAADVVAEVR